MRNGKSEISVEVTLNDAQMCPSTSYPFPSFIGLYLIHSQTVVIDDRQPLSYHQHGWYSLIYTTYICVYCQSQKVIFMF